MRTIVHLSDLHFGALDPHVIDPLLAAVTSASPHLVAVSGDLTQRARRSQFLQARAFLDRLPRPVIVVPGNHDVPLYDLVARFVEPLRRYRKYITEDLTPSYGDEEMLVVGLNSARSLAFRHGPGRVRSEQVLHATARLNMAAPAAVKVVVTHHPFEVPAGHDERHLIGGATMAMSWLASVGVDLFLSGHLHVSHVSRTAERYQIAGHSALVAQAGTVSRRERGEPGAFNVLRLDTPRLTIERHSWDGRARRFARSWEGTFARSATGWQ